MNIQEIINPQPPTLLNLLLNLFIKPKDNPYAYKFIKPHKRTIKVNCVYQTKTIRLQISFQLPLLCIVKVTKNLQLEAFYILQQYQGNFYPLNDHFGYNTSEFCMPHYHYLLNFKNKHDCLNKSIDAFFNSEFNHWSNFQGHLSLVNICYNPIQSLNKPTFNKLLLPHRN